jgi:UDP-N-acetylmuramoylalanine--D-glutamate ligase
LKAREAGLLPGAAWLGGNITVSPLSFLDSLSPDDDVVLELSSWQLGDLRGRLKNDTTEALLKPRAAIITAIMPDHLDRYPSMDAYVADKRVIYEGQDARDATIARDDEWGRSFLAESQGRPLVYADGPLPEGVSGGWLDTKSKTASHETKSQTSPETSSLNGGGPGFARIKGETVEVVPAKLLVPGAHNKKNLLAAALALLDLGLCPDFIRESLGTFKGIEHRLEFFHEAGGIRFYNDTAATIPEAAAAAIKAFDVPVVLVSGGADKKLDYGPLVRAAPGAKALVLLAGTGSDKLAPLFTQAALPFRGPFDSVDAAVRSAIEAAAPGDAVVLSPGCASFGMFVNEFDRGLRWKEAVRRLA